MMKSREHVAMMAGTGLAALMIQGRKGNGFDEAHGRMRVRTI